MCRDIAIEHLLWYFLYITISMNVFSSEGTVQVFKNLDVCLGVTAHWMEHRPVNQRGLQLDSQSGHMPGKKRSVVHVEKVHCD